MTPATSRCPGRTKDAFPNAEFSKIQPQNTWTNNKSSISSNKKHSHLLRVWSFEFHLKCLLSNHVELWFYPFVFFVFLILFPSLEVPYCIYCSFRLQFSSMLFGSCGFFIVCSYVHMKLLDQFCIGSRHTLPLIC